MGRRIDYLDDPRAPEATSLVPSVNVGVVNNRGELLLIRRTDNQNWAMPGGAMDLGKTIVPAGVRETREERVSTARSFDLSACIRTRGTSWSYEQR